MHDENTRMHKANRIARRNAQWVLESHLILLLGLVVALNAELYTETKDTLLILHFHVNPLTVYKKEYHISSFL